MNAIGKLGKLIIEYQNPIQIVLLAVLLAAAVFLIARAFINSRKKRQILSQINSTVTEINSAVTNLNRNKSDVIYIDNRTASQPQEPETSAQEHNAVDSGLSPDDAEKPGESQARNSAVAEAVEEPEEIEQDCIHTEIPKKYFSRDCGISKQGRNYTVEELERQIRE